VRVHEYVYTRPHECTEEAWMRCARSSPPRAPPAVVASQVFIASSFANQLVYLLRPREYVGAEVRALELVFYALQGP
jgi:hypothetical protein